MSETVCGTDFLIVVFPALEGNLIHYQMMSTRVLYVWILFCTGEMELLTLNRLHQPTEVRKTGLYLYSRNEAQDL